MPVISQKKKDKIAEQILHYLFSVAPEMKFTSEVAEEIARDEEFTKKVLTTLKEKGLTIAITKNKKGVVYLQRQRWRLSNEAFQAYSKRQSLPVPYTRELE